MMEEEIHKQKQLIDRLKAEWETEFSSNAMFVDTGATKGALENSPEPKCNIK